MPSASLEEFCDLVSDVGIKNAAALQKTLTEIATRYSFDLDPEYILKTFSFMNWTFAQGVWSNVQNAELRRDLQIALKGSLIIKLARQLSPSSSADATAAKAVFLTEEFNSFLLAYTEQMQAVACADAGTARVFALTLIQEEYGIADHVMNEIVPALWSDENASSEVESVAMQVNNVTQTSKPKGFLRRLFGG